MDTTVKYISHLVNHLLTQKNPEQMEVALRELLTANEMLDVANRLQIIELLEQGMPQRQIAETLGVGIATVTRGSHSLKNRHQIIREQEGKEE